jgi:acetyl esterase/lipase
VLLALRDGGDPLPTAAIALSPRTDLAATGDSLRTNAATEVMLDPVHVTDTPALYADALQLCHPYVSPLYGELAGLPSLLSTPAWRRSSLTTPPASPTAYGRQGSM